MGVLKKIKRDSLKALSDRKSGSLSRSRTSIREESKSSISPKDHQEMVRSFLNSEESRGLVVFHGLGTGKTLTSIFAAETFLKDNKKAKVVIILSASVKNQFIEQVKSVAKRFSKYEFYSRQEFVRLDSKSNSRSCSDNMIIVDEAHNVRNSDGKITKSIISCTDKAKKVLLLTATPLVNGVHEIGSMVRMLVPRSRIPLKHNSFALEFGEDGLKKERRIRRLLKDKISFYVSESGMEGFPSEEFHEVIVPMEERQCEIYDDVMRGKFSEKLEKVISDPSAMSKALVFFQKPRQFCNIVKDGKTRYQPKIDALTSRIVKAHKKGKKCIAYSQYIESGLDPIARVLKKNKIEFGVISGDTSKEDRIRFIKNYNSDKLKVLLLSRSAGEGLDLKETGEIHILEPHFHMASLYQVKGRGIRYKSHKDPDAVVKVFVYFAKKCDPTKESRGSHKTQSMDIILWYLNKQKQAVIDKFTDRVIIPSSIENSKYSFVKERNKLQTTIIDDSISSDDGMWV